MSPAPFVRPFCDLAGGRAGGLRSHRGCTSCVWRDIAASSSVIKLSRCLQWHEYVVVASDKIESRNLFLLEMITSQSTRTNSGRSTNLSFCPMIHLTILRVVHLDRSHGSCYDCTLLDRTGSHTHCSSFLPSRISLI